MNLLARISGPARVGLIFSAVAVILSVIGALRSTEPTAGISSILIATVISGLVWGVIAWAVATAVMDVEEEIEERDGATLE
jgi:formaldehyde-activating enzyme involved in methanogenesis